MCGFVGLIRPHISSTDAEFPQDLLKMVKGAGIKLKTRGPDQSGLWSDDSCALAHHRLHVIGSSDEGRQPIRDRTDRYVMVYNGAVYNFRNLGQSLDAVSLSNISCDTRTVIEGFVKHQQDWFKQLNGMFAIAIWDRREKELWLARDRFGQKPLYYGQGHSGFIFGSELKAILPLIGKRPEPDYNGLNHYLSYGYIPSPFTAFKGLKKLSAGEFLRLQTNATGESKVIVQKYSSEQPEKYNQLSEADVEDELRVKLELAVKRCLVSSKPLGTFLSGGVDSSVITAMTCRLSSHRVKTFSVGFQDHKFDERPYARQVAKYLETDHRDMVFNDRDIIPTLGKLSEIYDEPFGDSSAIPMIALAGITKEKVTVALSGDGADELFMGYPRHLEMARQQKLTNFPKLVFGMSKTLGDLTGSKKLKNLTQKRLATPEGLYFPMVSQFGDHEKLLHYTSFMTEFGDVASSHLLSNSFENSISFVEGALKADQDHYLPEDILTKSDRAAMSVSLEVRTPFLDNDLVDFSQRLPWTSKTYDGRLKALLKDAVASYLPPETLSRPKQGFSVPLVKWLNDPLKDFLRDILLTQNAFILTLLNRPYVEQLINDSSQREGQHGHHLWSILVLELWAQKWLAA